MKDVLVTEFFYSQQTLKIALFSAPPPSIFIFIYCPHTSRVLHAARKTQTQAQALRILVLGFNKLEQQGGRGTPTGTLCLNRTWVEKPRQASQGPTC